MLQPAWYLITHDDFWQQRSHVPPPPDLITLSGALRNALSDEAGIGPARTAVATEALALGAEYLTFSIPLIGTTLPAPADTGRLLLGLNLTTAHLAQATAQLAYRTISASAGAGLGRLAPPRREALAHSLIAASHEFADAAGQLKDAHVAIAAVTRRRPSAPRAARGTDSH